QGRRHADRRERAGADAVPSRQSAAAISRDLCRGTRLRSLRTTGDLPAHERHYATGKPGRAEGAFFVPKGNEGTLSPWGTECSGFVFLMMKIQTGTDPFGVNKLRSILRQLAGSRSQ